MAIAQVIPARWPLHGLPTEAKAALRCKQAAPGTIGGIAKTIRTRAVEFRENGLLQIRRQQQGSRKGRRRRADKTSGLTKSGHRQRPFAGVMDPQCYSKFAGEPAITPLRVSGHELSSNVTNHP
ncbi:hypothetical protein D3C87_1704890 [compost metagenome]